MTACPKYHTDNSFTIFIVLLYLFAFGGQLKNIFPNRYDAGLFFKLCFLSSVPVFLTDQHVSAFCLNFEVASMRCIHLLIQYSCFQVLSQTNIGACYVDFIWDGLWNPLGLVLRHLYHQFSDCSLNVIYTILHKSCCSFLHAETTENRVFHPLRSYKTACLARFKKLFISIFSFHVTQFWKWTSLQRHQYWSDVRLLSLWKIVPQWSGILYVFVSVLAWLTQNVVFACLHSLQLCTKRNNSLLYSKQTI